jgi:hypothetical protein
MSTTSDAMLASARSAIIAVGEGRGFLVKSRQGPLVVTAAHCLPHLPPPHPASHAWESSYQELLGPLGADKPNVRAECLFVDPIADVAVLCEPDNQVYFDEWKKYEALVQDLATLPIGTATVPSGVRRWGLDSQWHPATVQNRGWVDRILSLAITNPEAVAPGTSGSPIVAGDGRAIGLISCPPDLNPALSKTLSPWLLVTMVRRAKVRRIPG